MDCLVTEDLTGRWDGLLSEREVREQAEHLDECPRCRRLAATLDDLRNRLPESLFTRCIGVGADRFSDPVSSTGLRNPP